MTEFLFVELTTNCTRSGRLAADATTRRKAHAVVQRNAKRKLVKPGVLRGAAVKDHPPSNRASRTKHNEYNRPIGLGSTESQLRNRSYEAGLMYQLAQWYWPHGNHRLTFHPWTILVHTAEVSKVSDTARYAIVLLSVGHVLHDSRMVMEGNKRHFAAVEGLRQLVGQWDDRSRTDAVSILVTIFYLLLCEMNRTVATVPGAWRKHVEGMTAVVRSGELSVHSFPQRKHAFFRVRHLCLMTALWDRRALGIPPRQLEYQLSGTGRIGLTERLIRLALSLPAFLERTDVALSSEIRCERAVDQLQSQLRRLQLDLESWHLNFSNSPLGQGSLCRQQPICIGGEKPQSDVSQLYDFTLYSRQSFCGCYPCYIVAHGFAFCRLCQLFCLQAQLDLAPLGGNQIPAVAQLETEKGAIADSLREFVEFFDAVTEGIFRRIAAVQGLLLFLTKHLTRTADHERLQWCQNVEQRLRSESDFLAWDAAVPWSLMPLTIMFDYD